MILKHLYGQEIIPEYFMIYTHTIHTTLFVYKIHINVYSKKVSEISLVEI